MRNKPRRRPGQFFEVIEARLRNGLRVRLVPDHTLPTASLYTFFHVGSRNERPGITGISHLFEHMFFNGAKKYGPGEFDRVLEASGGDCNAYTTPDYTAYFENFASEALETVLDLESDRMRSLRISPKVLDTEREVVLEERRSTVDNDVGGLMSEELEALAYKAHPYRWPVIGWERDVARITKAECDAFFGTYYAPSNATLYLAGDFEPDRALALIRKHYATIPVGPPAPEVVNAEPEPKGERRAEVRYPAQAPSLLMGYPAPRAKDEDTLVLDVIQFALSVGQGSRLTRELVYRRSLAVSLSIDWSWRIDPGLITVFAELKPDSNVEEVRAAIDAELARVAADGLEPKELEKARNNLVAHLWSELSTNASRAGALGTHELLLGDWRTIFELAERYAAVTGEQVRDAAERYFDPHRRAVVTLVPERGAAA